ncbi:glycosyltransferase family 4 protein [Flavobacterium sp.]|uniref:glycosyltransferase family 4 protein n=1 Tax=Flavobacterium sp. TaxID=239 RepID=UPI00352701F1
MKEPKLIRITTVPLSLDKLLGEQLRFMNQHFEVTAISADKIELERVAKKYGVKNYHVEMTRAITPFSDLRAIIKLYHFLSKEKPEMVHTHTPKAGLVGMIASKLAGVPIRLHTVAGLPLMETTGAKRKVLNFVEKLTYYFATKIYPNSKGLEDFIIKEKFCKPSKLKIIGNGSSNGINTNHFNPTILSESEKNNLKFQLGINQNDFVFIFVGRLVKDKGINELVTAFSNIQTSNSKLLLIGPFEPELDPLMSETVQQIKENPNIINVGYQNDVRPYFAISNCLVFPSYREGFPNVVMQAGAMGLPCIVSNINGCNEIVVEGENGTIIPVKNDKAIQEAMIRMIYNAEFYNQLKDKARPMILKSYEQNIVWQALLKEYQLLLKKNIYNV